MPRKWTGDRLSMRLLGPLPGVSARLQQDLVETRRQTAQCMRKKGLSNARRVTSAEANVCGITEGFRRGGMLHAAVGPRPGRVAGPVRTAATKRDDQGPACQGGQVFLLKDSR